MKNERKKHENPTISNRTIPAVLYGEPAKQGYVFLHGQMGRKEEAEAFAQVVCPKGLQVLSMDLPGHGERQGRGEELLPWTAVADIQAALDWAERRWKTTSLRANSIGAYFAMLAFDTPGRALLVSPILDMEYLILAMMGWAGVTEEQLQAQGEIATAFGQTLSWKYLCWVREHSVHNWTCPLRWRTPTAILYGARDHLTDRETVEAFAARNGCRLTVEEAGEHWFHTPEQLAVLRKWEETEALPCGVEISAW